MLDDLDLQGGAEAFHFSLSWVVKCSNDGNMTHANSSQKVKFVHN